MPNFAVYEFGHLLDVQSSIKILVEEEEDGHQFNRFSQDEFEFGKCDDLKEPCLNDY